MRYFITQRTKKRTVAFLAMALTSMLGMPSPLLAAIPPWMNDFITPTAEVGSIKVDAGVTANGQASINIPIAVPPGRLGMQPELSISYSSSGDAGMLGMGFSLNGIPSLTRCPMDTVHPDRVMPDMVDLCLGGERLILSAGDHMTLGASYRLRRTPNTRIDIISAMVVQGVTEDIAFQANYGDGLIAVFGYYPDNYHAGRWRISYTEDPFGNRVAYSYLAVKDGLTTLALLPDQITYTLNNKLDPDNPLDFSNQDHGTRKVQFIYDMLPADQSYTFHTRFDDNLDMQSLHDQGDRSDNRAMHLLDRRLSQIETSVQIGGAGNPFTSASYYKLEYSNASSSARSLLSSITRCDRQNICLPPATIEWTMGDYIYSVKNLDNFAVATAPTADDMRYSVSADFDRDGKDEIAYVSGVDADDSTYNWLVWDPETGITETSARARVSLEPATEWTMVYDDGEIVGEDGWSDFWYGSFGNADVDMVYLTVTDPDTGDTVRRASGGLQPQVADFNGDGYPDIVAPHCATASGDGCRNGIIKGIEYPYANAFNFNLGAGHPVVLYSDETPPVVGAPTVNLSLNQFSNAGQIYLSHVGEIDGDGHPDLYVCAGDNPHMGRWYLALNRFHEAGSEDFQVIRTLRHCKAWEFYQVFDSNSNGLSELHLTKSADFLHRRDACLLQAGGGCLDGSWKASGLYHALEFPRVNDLGETIPVAQAIEMINPPGASTEGLDGDTAWPSGYSWGSIPLDLGTRVLDSCQKPGEGRNRNIPPEAYAEAADQGELLSFDQEVALLSYWQGAISYEQAAAEFPTGVLGGDVRFIAPFSASGPSRDIKVDINGDGLVDIMRLLAVPNGGTLSDSKDGAIIYKQSSNRGAVICDGETRFHYVYGYYINHGGVFTLEQHSPLLLTFQQPWLARNILNKTILADVNLDNRPDITVPDYKTYLDDPSKTSSWITYIPQASLDSVSHIELDNIFDIPYDLAGEPGPHGNLPPDSDDVFKGPVWFSPEVVSVSHSAATDVNGALSQGYYDWLEDHQFIASSIHLNQKRLNDVIVFGASDSEAMSVIAFEKAGLEPDYVWRVNNGLGALEAQFEYAASESVDGVVNSVNEFPAELSKQAPARIVTRMTRDAGNRNHDQKRWTDYEYRGGRADRKGGFLGFASTTKRHHSPGFGNVQFAEHPDSIVHRIFSQYQQYDAANKLYPFAGIATDVVREKRALSNADSPLRLVHWNAITPDLFNSGHSSVLGTYVDILIERHYELPENFRDSEYCLPEDLLDRDLFLLKEDISNVIKIDEFGNTLTKETSSLNGFSTLTTHEVTNLAADDGFWKIGMIDSEAITFTAPDGSLKWRHREYDWDLVSGSKTHVTRVPTVLANDPEVWLQTETVRDFRGNIVALHHTDLNGIIRSSFTHWDKLGYFTEATTNADGWGTSTTFEPFFGALLATQKPNTDAQQQSCIDGLGRDTCSRLRYGLGGQILGGALSFQREPQLLDNGAYQVITLRDGSETERVIYDRLSRQSARIYSVLSNPGVDPTVGWYKILTTYNPRGLRESVSVPLPYPGVTPGDGDLTRFLYDHAGRLKTTVLSGNRGLVSYGHHQLTNSVTDADGKTTLSRRSPSGDIIYTQDGKGVGTCYLYGATGMVIRVSRNCANENGHLDGNYAYQGEFDATFDYDGIDRRTQVTTPEAGASVLEYNAFGDITYQSDSIGNITHFNYDHLGRLESRLASDHSVTLNYDVGLNALGQLSSSRVDYNDGIAVEKNFYYDNWGRANRTVLETNGVTLEESIGFTPANQVDHVDYLSAHENIDGSLSFSTRYLYGSRGFLINVGDVMNAQRFFVHRLMDGYGHLTWGEFGDGTDMEADYNPRTGHITSLRSTNAALIPSLIMGWQYQWTHDGDLSYRLDEVKGVEECFVYDDAHQFTERRQLLTGHCGQGVSITSLQLSYDNYGRIEHKSDVGDYLYETNTGRLSTAGAYSLAYDGKGQAIDITSAAGVNNQPAWYSFNKMRGIQGPASEEIRFYYDASGALTLKVETMNQRDSYYLGNQTRIITPAGTEERFTINAMHGAIAEVAVTGPLAPEQPGEQRVSFLHTDFYGTPTAIVANGNVLQQRYDPFGRRTDTPGAFHVGVNAEPVTVGFTGHEAETVYDLINMRARYFHPLLATFVQADTVIPDPRRGIDWNRYAYVRNNPFRYTDPTGHKPEGDDSEEADSSEDEIAEDDTDVGSSASCEELARSVGVDGGVCIGADYSNETSEEAGAPATDGTACSDCSSSENGDKVNNSGEANEAPVMGPCDGVCTEEQDAALSREGFIVISRESADVQEETSEEIKANLAPLADSVPIIDINGIKKVELQRSDDRKKAFQKAAATIPEGRLDTILILEFDTQFASRMGGGRLWYEGEGTLTKYNARTGEAIYSISATVHADGVGDDGAELAAAHRLGSELSQQAIEQ